MQLQAFKFQSDEEQTFNKITTIEIDGEPWFVAKEICDALDINNPSQAIKDLDDDEKNTVTLNEGIRGNPNKTIVSESGLYALIFKSRKKSANKFRKWITKEVIPQIRKKGFYGKIDRSAAPNFYVRYKDNFHKIERGHFSVISELFVTLHSEFEKLGYEIPDKGIDGKGIYPDISVGKMFADFLRKNDSEFKDNYQMYKHSFPDERYDVDARMYPVEALPIFRRFIFEVWIPKNAENYFKKKDPLALDYLPKLIE